MNELDAKNMDEILKKLLTEKSMTSYKITNELFEKEGRSYVTTLLHEMEIYSPPVIEIKKGALVVALKTDYTEQFLINGGFSLIAKNRLIELEKMEERENLELQKLRAEVEDITQRLVDYETVKSNATKSLNVSILSALATTASVIVAIIALKKC